MTRDDASPVWRSVWRRLGEWEADDGTGSARPVFAAAWAMATQTLSEPATPQEVEAAWQAWLHAGRPLTTARAAELLAQAAARGRTGQLFGATALRQLRLVRREPGQEG